jgi:hypothetical protein
MKYLPVFFLGAFGANAFAQSGCPGGAILDSIANNNPAAVAQQMAAQRAAIENAKAQTELLRAQADNLRAQNARLEAEKSAAESALRDKQSPSTQPNGEFKTNELSAKFKVHLVEARWKHPDFDAVINRQDVPLTPAMQQAVYESEEAGELIYYFGKHPEEAARIAKLSPISSAREIGKIENKL